MFLYLPAPESSAVGSCIGCVSIDCPWLCVRRVMRACPSSVQPCAISICTLGLSYRVSTAVNFGLFSSSEAKYSLHL